MATEILLTSEAFVKAVSSISDNIAGKYIKASIREAQEIKLRGIFGDALLDKVKDLYDRGELTGDYQALVDHAQYFLAYSALVEVARKVTFKVVNAGVVRTGDENVQVADQLDMSKVQADYQNKADAQCLALQNYILANYTKYPELTEGDCHRIKANLYSAATCGIFLGGPRGKRLS